MDAIFVIIWTVICVMIFVKLVDSFDDYVGFGFAAIGGLIVTIVLWVAGGLLFFDVTGNSLKTEDEGLKIYTVNVDNDSWGYVYWSGGDIDCENCKYPESNDPIFNFLEGKETKNMFVCYKDCNIWYDRVSDPEWIYATVAGEKVFDWHK